MSERTTLHGGDEPTGTKTWVTKYGHPETRAEVEHKEGECAACLSASAGDGDITFIELERADGTTVIRRVEGFGDEPGLRVTPYGMSYTSYRVPLVGCRIVSREDADREIAGLPVEPPPPPPKNEIYDALKSVALGIFGGGGFGMREAAQMGADLGRQMMAKDPCVACGHGEPIHRVARRTFKLDLPDGHCSHPGCKCVCYAGKLAVPATPDEKAGK